MGKVYKILIVLSVLLSNQCSTQYDEVAPDTEILVVVSSSAGTRVPNAQVYLFDDENNFTVSVTTGVITGAVGQTTTDSQGIASFSKLNSSSLYSIYAQFTDVSGFIYDNGSAQYTLKNKLEKGSVTTTTIVLQPVSADLQVNIVNPSNQPISAADVYLFSDKNAFDQTITSGSAGGFMIQTKSTATGQALFLKLNSHLTYYLFAQYVDPATQLTFNNAIENLTVAGLKSGSSVTVTTTARPVDALITFWSSTANAAAFPIDLFINSNKQSTLSQGLSAAPTAFQTGAFTMRVKQGAYTYQGKSSTGCTWTGQVTVTEGQSIMVQMPDCAVGTIAFYTDASNSLKLPIGVTLNANDDIGNIISTLSTTPVDCTDPSLLKIFRAPGNYTYESISVSGNCVWTGAFSLSANECKIIYLPTCN